MQLIKSPLTLASAIACLAASAGAQISFQPAQTYSLFALRPDDVATGDFDMDGDADIAITTGSLSGAAGPDYVEIFLNQGGTFAAGQVILVGNNVGTAALAAGDFDGDGDVDLAVTLKNFGQVQTLVNTGGVFTPGASAAVGGTTPAHMDAGDIDGDGDLDLAISNRDSNNVSILMNSGAGTFALSSSVATGTDPRDVVLADLNGDCRLDLGIAAHDSRRVDVAMNNGAGGFGAVTSYPVPLNNKPTGMAAADVDGDGDKDLLTTTDQNDVGQLVVMTNLGGTFVSAATFIGGINPGLLVAADFDADGDPDVATTDQDASSVIAAPNMGGGIFGMGTAFGVGLHPSGIATTDFDGNGSLDLAVANRDSNTMSVLLNAGMGGAEAYCSTSPNSVGAGARIDSTGTLSHASNAFSITASCCPAGQNGLFFYGTASNDIPFGNGRLCVQGPFFRLNPPAAIDGTGRSTRHVDFNAPPANSGAGQITPGNAYYFQFWYRDPAGGGSFFNTSDALRVTFRP